MKPIKAPKIIQNGIVIYVPAINKFDLVNLKIFYSAKNPLFSWGFCDESPYLIWDKTDQNFDRGLMFTYQTKSALDSGYYKVSITMSSNDRTETIEGSQIFGVLQKRNTLYVGLPYSAFPPIDVS